MEGQKPMLKKILYGVVFVLLFIGVWNLFEFLYSSFITRSGFEFHTGSNIFLPMAIGIAVYVVVFVFGVVKSKKK